MDKISSSKTTEHFRETAVSSRRHVSGSLRVKGTKHLTIVRLVLNWMESRRYSFRCWINVTFMKQLLHSVTYILLHSLQTSVRGGYTEHSVLHLVCTFTAVMCKWRARHMTLGCRKGYSHFVSVLYTITFICLIFSFSILSRICFKSARVAASTF